MWNGRTERAEEIGYDGENFLLSDIRGTLLSMYN